MESLQPTPHPASLPSVDYYVDTHAHLFDPDFDPDRAETLARASAVGVRQIILPAVDSRSHRALLDTVRAYPDMCRAAIGMHPTSVNENTRWREELQIVRQLLKEPPVKWCAIGEVGLDLHWSTSSLTAQCQALVIQMQLAIEYDLPLILHVRDAWNEIFPLLEPLQGQIRGVFHSFQGTLKDYERIATLGGFAIGVGGFITYKNSSVVKVLEQIPIENMVLETDSPYLTPVPYRGTRNESAHIPVIAARLAEIKGLSVETVRAATTARAAGLFL
ncbi:TatD family hydrolase [uncultured Rikenella sp.]|uniref:TatD family hydrolase n=1 Tax=uncultured Rikenella sp. TaxID=368003 RepID=UPI00261B2363|nr:TatD family hydrolase [uncultured Rikenella sp.]